MRTLARATWQLFATPAVALPIALSAWAFAGGGGGCSPATNPSPPAAPSSLTYEVVQQLGPTNDFSPTLTVGHDGNVYGTTTETVFRIDAAGALTTVHTFPFEGSPARLVLGNDGFLYGFTSQRAYFEGVPGSPVQAVFFRLDYQQTYTTLLTLPKYLATDLVVGSDGAFYAGAAYECWAEACWNNAGLIKITSAGGYTLLGGQLGLFSPVPQVVGSDGALYGTQAQNPSEANIFRLDSTGTFTNIHAMNDTEGFISNLALGSDGQIYGTSQYNDGFGALIRFDNTGSVTLLHQFTGGDGAYPAASLTVGSDGAIYGVAEYGGTAGSGTVYRVDIFGTFTAVHAFDWNNGGGGNPGKGLLLAKDGALYGVTPISAFRIDTAGTVTYPVFPNTRIPSSPLVQGNDCAFYGTADYWGSVGLNSEVYRLYEPGHLCQRVEFSPLADRKLSDSPFTVNATASSGLPVTFSASGSCTVSDDQVTLTRVGTCTVTASQAGDSRYDAAAAVSQAFSVFGSRSCGLGPELALLLAPLWWLRRGRER